ncbi:hypothetical protein ABES02_29225 [Neobacillus pocheonensis]|uniref:hypothetical protein n=1 Tax=Neobacillus pocheonensis TaxID=363869 RepID=UPI003D2CA81C
MTTTSEMKVSLQQAVQSILTGSIQSFGYHRAYFADLPDYEPKDFGSMDLSDGDHNARIEDETLMLDLWFTDHYGCSWPEHVVLNRRTVISRDFGAVAQVKLRIAVALLDVAYLNVDQERFWVENTMALLEYDPGAELKGKQLEEWESAWETYISKLNRLQELKDMGRYGYQLRQPYKAVAIAAGKLKDQDPEFCQRIGIL